MKNITPSILAAAFILMTGCANRGAYFSNRSQDAVDIFTASVGDGWGLKARGSLVNIGLYWGDDSKGVRNGYVMNNKASAREITTPLPIFGNMGPEFEGVHSLEWFKGNDDHRESNPDPRGKNFESVGYYLPFYSVSKTPEYYTQLEVAVGLQKTCRLGLNFGELLDFALGWATIDIYGDDINKIEKSNHH